VLETKRSDALLNIQRNFSSREKGRDEREV